MKLERTLGADGLAAPAKIERLAFSPDGRHLAAIAGSRIYQWDAAGGTPIDVGEKYGSLLATPRDDGAILTVTSHAIYAERKDTQTEIARIPGRSVGFLEDIAGDPSSSVFAAIFRGKEYGSANPSRFTSIDIGAGKARALADAWLNEEDLAAMGLSRALGAEPRILGVTSKPSPRALVSILFTSSDAGVRTAVALVLLQLDLAKRTRRSFARVDAAVPLDLAMTADRSALATDPSLKQVAVMRGVPSLVDSTTGELLRRLGDEPFLSGVYRGNGALLGASSKELVEWDAAGKEIRRARLARPIDPPVLAISEQSRLLALASGASLDLFGLADLVPRKRRSGHSGSVARLAMSPDGRTLASADGHTLKLWLVASGELLWTRSFQGITTLLFSRERRELVVTAGSTAYILETGSGEIASSWDVPGLPANGTWWRRDGTLVLANVLDPEPVPSTILLREGTDSREFARLVGNVYRPDGVACGGDTLIAWNEYWASVTGEDVQREAVSFQRDRLWSLALSADGRWIAVAGVGGTVEIIDPQTTQTAHRTTWARESVKLVGWSAAGDRIAVGVDDGQVGVIGVDPAKGTLVGAIQVLASASRSQPASFAFAPDGRTLFAGREDGSISQFALDD